MQRTLTCRSHIQQGYYGCVDILSDRWVTHALRPGPIVSATRGAERDALWRAGWKTTSPHSKLSQSHRTMHNQHFNSLSVCPTAALGLRSASTSPQTSIIFMTVLCVMLKKPKKQRFDIWWLFCLLLSVFFKHSSTAACVQTECDMFGLYLKLCSKSHFIFLLCKIYAD